VPKPAKTIRVEKWRMILDDLGNDRGLNVKVVWSIFFDSLAVQFGCYLLAVLSDRSDDD
jgi:hypothetical protein